MNETIEPLKLRAGPLSLRFDEGGLRYIRLGDREVVRRVYCAVRDANWGTVPDKISNLNVDAREDSFRVEFDVENRQGEIDFSWHGTIVGEASGRIVFEMDGLAKSSFQKNRIGFCVLHPMECAGAAVEIEHADGSKERTEFPRYIAAQNPFLNVVKMRHAAAAGVDVELKFEGDVFETEDQRNWLDASFKTFCTPLSRPFPVLVRAGERIMQRVTLQLHGKPANLAAAHADDDEITLIIADQPVGPLPKIGFSMPGAEIIGTYPISDRQIRLLRMLRPQHLRCELHLLKEFEQTLERAAQTAAELETALEVALFMDDLPNCELQWVIGVVARLRPPIARWAVFPERGWATTRGLANVAVPQLRKHDPSIPIGGGTPAYFTELNRNRPPVELLDFITWSQQPQVHAIDNASIVETLAAHTHAVESARQICGGLPLVVGPITLKARVNPYATGPWPPALAPGELPPQFDPRQITTFAAGWTLGSIKYLAEAGVQAATYYELFGPQGVMEADYLHVAQVRLGPSVEASRPYCVFPMFHVFADLAELRDAQVFPVRSSDPLRVEALAVGKCLLIANLSREQQAVKVATPAKSASLRVLDDSMFEPAQTEPEAYRAATSRRAKISDELLRLTLEPYSIARVDFSSS